MPAPVETELGRRPECEQFKTTALLEKEPANMKRLQRQSRVEFLTVPTLGQSLRSKSAEHEPPEQPSPHLRHICVQNMKSFSMDACR
ncbi:Hypp4878 [Branchiostoma lanceolatum]|uniref:Hypp4878 protein n=1 Tax=Branchiostoma lanceolatum TaxID=7740 RepID=A0A8K0F312_BRALA|nr:Hypp4878 [Branchiostoma lanceolatum]